MVHTVLSEELDFTALNALLGRLVQALESDSPAPPKAGWILSPLAAQKIRLAIHPIPAIGPGPQGMTVRDGYPFGREMHQASTLLDKPFVILGAFHLVEPMEVFLIDTARGREEVPHLYAVDEGVRFLCQRAGGQKPLFRLWVQAEELNPQTGEYEPTGEHIDPLDCTAEIGHFDSVDQMDAWVQDHMPTHFGRTAFADQRRGALAFGKPAELKGGRQR